ncbi:B12-binding domain-containing radical SAM protein [Spirochaetota bacterium]
MNKNKKPYTPKKISGDNVEVLFLEIVIKSGFTTPITPAYNIFMSLLAERGITSAIHSFNSNKIGSLDFKVDKTYIRGVEPDGEYRKELDTIIKKTNPKIIAMSLVTSTYKRGKKIAQEIKKSYPHIVLITGGIHPTFAPEQTLKDGFDYVFVRDGFQTIAQTVEDILLKRGPDTRIIAPPRPFVEFPDSLPLAHPNANDNRSCFYFGTFKNLLFTSYGCSEVCKFCAGAGYYKTGRIALSPERVVDEMQWQIEQFDNNEFLICDPVLVKDSKDDLTRMLKIMDLIDEQEHEIFLTTEIKADIISTLYRERIDDFKKIYKHCTSTVFGIESVRENNLQTYKHQTINDIEIAIEAINSLEIITAMFYIIGFPYDTEKSIKEDLKLVRNMAGPNTFIPIFIFTPDPLSKLFREMEEYNLIATKDWDKYAHKDLVWRHKNFNPPQLKKLYHEMRETYGTPAWAKEMWENEMMQI